MAKKAVVDAVMARMEALWTSTPMEQVNVNGEPPNDENPFIVVQFPFARTDRVAMGQRHYREEGGIRFVISTMRGSGQDEALQLADDIADLFRDEKFGGVNTQVPSAPFTDDTNDEGKYFQVSVVVPYWFQFTD